ncbi:hypothetical protein EXU57_12045 [Segetibacter sp. 3557_3]|uniref:hypothetical protein n=1 Tax=Segetibacter sp. 3557_3 TaxID=2547429 RepID=UPI00105911CC|nr:hypothetical protein [Segetibacter sp. 3557_3]TDH26214.1 hypothetical protein EXU57_12045 [Segetibacter sp. 3557_3]
MKQILVMTILLCVSVMSYAQNDKYQKAMEKTIAAFDTCKTAEDYQQVSAAFERIGDAEKTQWLPYYYAALAMEFKGFTDQKGDKDEIANRAEALIAKAEAIEPKNSELFLLKNMSATLHMLVDPMNRWQQYGAVARQALGTAKAIDAQNPRVYLMEGESLMNTPAQFGGGKDKARQSLEKSVELFKAFKPVTPLHPVWGQKRAERMLAAASK